MPQSSILCTVQLLLEEQQHTDRQFLKDKFTCIIEVLNSEAIERSRTGRHERMYQGQILTVYLINYIKYAEVTPKE